MNGDRCFPRLYAAASLKPVATAPALSPPSPFSAALCRGLIEAARSRGIVMPARARFPRLYAAASLKHRTRAP